MDVHPLKKWRLDQGLTQAEASGKLGLKSAQAWSKYERGERWPEGEVMRQMIDLTGVTADEIMKYLLPLKERAA